MIAAGDTVTQMVRNIDIAPTILALAGVQSTGTWTSIVLSALRGEAPASRASCCTILLGIRLPHTPTTFALRGDRYKFLFYHVLDTTTYDLVSDRWSDITDRARYADTVRAMARAVRSTAGQRRDSHPSRRGDWHQGVNSRITRWACTVTALKKQ